MYDQISPNFPILLLGPHETLFCEAVSVILLLGSVIRLLGSVIRLLGSVIRLL